jgi:hypothetical protein
MLASKARYTDFETLIPFPESGQVTPVIDRTYTLANVPMPWVTSRPDKPVEIAITCDASQIA